MTETTNERLIRGKLEVAAKKAGLIDLDWLKVVDMTKVTLEADGVTVKGVNELVTSLKETKPYLFRKLAKDMSEDERKLALKEIASQQRESVELDMAKKAADMTDGERRDWMAKHQRKFG